MAFLAVAQEWTMQGVGAGEASVYRGLGGHVSLRIVRESLKRLKAGLRQRLSVLAKQDRKHVEVQLRDGVWSLDAQELARGVTGLPGAGILQAEMLREVASTKTIGAAVSPPATGEEIVAQLERAAAERGSWPLVLATDNGAAYRSQAVEDCLVMQEVVHLRNEPRTPQHNPWVEHGHGEHQEEMLLSSWTPPFVVRELAAALERARLTLDHHRLRRTRGWKTADDYDVGLAPAAGVISRAVFYETACQAVARVTAGLDRARERRRAEREAILATLQSFNVISRSRGGAPSPAPNAN
jgi:transposase InsO family protein